MINGEVGSTPTRHATTYIRENKISIVGVSMSPARKRFRRQLGFANFNLNTTIVGLEAVKEGIATKPPDLAIDWNPKNLPAAAAQARYFVTSELLVYLVDALDQYLKL